MADTPALAEKLTERFDMAYGQDYTGNYLNVPVQTIQKRIQQLNTNKPQQEIGMTPDGRLVSKAEFDDQFKTITQLWTMSLLGEAKDQQGETFDIYAGRFEHYKDVHKKPLQERAVARHPGQVTPGIAKPTGQTIDQVLWDNVRKTFNSSELTNSEITLLIQKNQIDNWIFSEKLSIDQAREMLNLAELKDKLRMITKPPSDPFFHQNSVPEARSGLPVLYDPTAQHLVHLFVSEGIDKSVAQGIVLEIMQKSPDEFAHFKQLKFDHLKKDWVKQCLKLRMISRRKEETKSHQALPAIPPRQQKIEQLRAALVNSAGATEQQLALLERTGMLNYDAIELNQDDLKGYYQILLRNYRSSHGAVPGDKKVEWFQRAQTLLGYLGDTSYTAENMRWLVNEYCVLSNESSLDEAKNNQLISAFKTCIERLPAPFSNKEFIGSVLQIIHAYPNAQSPYLRQLSKIFDRTIPTPPPSPIQSPTLRREQLSPEVQALDWAISQVKSSYGITDKECSVIRQSPPVNIESQDVTTHFYQQMLVWAALKDKGFPVPFDQYWPMVKSGEITRQMLDNVETADEGNPNDPRPLKAAGAPIIKAYVRHRPELHNISDDQLERFTTVSLWHKDLVATLDSLLELFKFQTIFKPQDQCLNLDDIAWAASELLLTADDRSNIKAFNSDKQTRSLIEKNHQKIAENPVVRAIGNTSEVNDISPPGIPTLRICAHLVGYQTEAEYYKYNLDKKDDQQAFLAAFRNIGLVNLDKHLENKQQLKERIKIWCKLGNENEGVINYLIKNIGEMHELLNSAHPEKVSTFMSDRNLPTRLQADITLVLQNLACIKLPDFVAQMNALKPLLEAARLVDKMETGIKDRVEFQQHALHRPKVDEYLTNKLHCRLGERTVPDGSCGYHAIALSTGFSSHEVRKKTAQAARDLIAYSASHNKKSIESNDPDYIQRIETASEHCNLAYAAERIEFIGRVVEEEGPVNGKGLGNYWMTSDDLQFVAVAFGSPVLYLGNPIKTHDGHLPCERYYSNTGEEIWIPGEWGKVRELVSNSDTIGIVNLGEGQWSHWEPLKPLPGSVSWEPITDTQPRTPADDKHKTVAAEFTTHGSQDPLQVEQDTDENSLAGMKGHNYLSMNNDPLMSLKYQNMTAGRIAFKAVEEHHPVFQRSENIQGDTESTVSQGNIQHVRASDSDESIPLDPNFCCLHCENQYAIGEIQKYRRHFNGHKKETT